MLRWIAWSASLSAPVGKDGDGGSTRAHLEAAAKKGNAVAIAKLAGPPYPAHLGYLWEWATELAGSRRYGMNGAEPIGYVEIEAWARLTDTRPFPHEVAALLAIDRVLCRPETFQDVN